MSRPDNEVHAATRVYVDGYNLFYGSLKNRGLLWLGLGEFADRLAGQAVDRVVYCTAMVRSGPGDPQKAVRQQLYLKAVQADPRVKVQMGVFRARKTRRRLCSCNDAACPCFVRVAHFEEKGSDVNLASHLVRDGCRGRFSRAIVVTGDSDLVEPIRLLVAEEGLRVDVVNPQRSRSGALAGAASAYRHLNPEILHRSQMPEEVNIPGASPVRRPAAWGNLRARASCEPADAALGSCCDAGSPVEVRKFPPPVAQPGEGQ